MLGSVCCPASFREWLRKPDALVDGMTSREDRSFLGIDPGRTINLPDTLPHDLPLTGGGASATV